MSSSSSSKPGTIVREGNIMFERSSMGVKKFKSRYLVIEKTGVIQLWKTAAQKKSTDIITLEGGETIELRAVRGKYSFGFVLVDVKRSWNFACSTQKERKSWVSAVEFTLKQLAALSKLERMVEDMTLETKEGKLEIAQTFADLGQLDQARRFYSQLIVEHGDDELVHLAYENFLVKFARDYDTAEENFVRRLRFIVVDQRFMRTKAGKKVRELTQQMAFFKKAETADTPKTDVGFDINKYRVANSFQGVGIPNPEERWPRLLLKVDSGALDKVRPLVQGWVAAGRDHFPSKKFEYSYLEVEHSVFAVLLQCIAKQKGVQKLHIRLHDVLGSVGDHSDRYKVAAAADATAADDHYSADDEKKSCATTSSSATAAALYEDADDDLEDMLADIDLDDTDEDDDAVVAKVAMPGSLAHAADLDAILHGDGGAAESGRVKGKKVELSVSSGRSHSSGGKVHIAAKGMRKIGGRRQLTSVKIKELGGIVDEMELSFFDSVESKLAATDSVHINMWTGILLVWIVRRDLLTHIGGGLRQEKYVRVILDFLYLWTKGCFQHFGDALDRRLVLSAVFSLCDPSDPEESKYKLCLQAVKALCDPRVDYAHKSAIFEFIENEGWLRALTTKAQKLSSTAMLTKGLRSELKKYYFEFDVIYGKLVFSDAMYQKLNRIKAERFVKDRIERQDHDLVQGKCTWGPRMPKNTFDYGAFKVVASHRFVDPFTDSEARALDFDIAYLRFIIAIADKLRPDFEATVTGALLTKLPSAEIKPAAAKSLRDWQRSLKQLMKAKKTLASPKAARFLSFCSMSLAFENLKDLLIAFLLLDKAFTITKLVNQMQESVYVRDNVRQLCVYVLFQHPSNRWIKLVCELRMTLKAVKRNEERRVSMRDHFEEILTPKIVYDVQREVFDSLGLKKKEQIGLLATS